MRAIKACFKVIAAGLVSIVILCGLLFFYYFIPVHEENTKGNTDYVWLPNSIWVKTSEGISFGKIDENGYNNKSVVENPDILMLGSSHTEAMNVMQDENAAFLLSEKLKGTYSVYNMSICGHYFFKVCQYLPATLQLSGNVPKLVIIETSEVDVSQSGVEEVLLSSAEYTPSHNAGILGMLQRVPFFRALYHQKEAGLVDLFLDASYQGSAAEAAAAAPVPEEPEAPAEIDRAAYAELFSYLRNMEEAYGTQILIVYHPTEQLMPDGSVYFSGSGYCEAFSEYADEYGIAFVDMTDRLEKMYYEEHHVAHGFCTGLLASGHMNKYGHAAMAEELYKAIRELEEDGVLCQ